MRSSGHAPAVQIRRIRPDEGEGFRAIRLRALRESPEAFGSTLAETAARHAQYWDERARCGASGEENILFIAEHPNGWIGVAGGFIDDSTDTRNADLVSMWVAPPGRRQGVGRRLIAEVAGWARNREARRLVLWVTEGNDAAISLYRLSGFRETGQKQPVPSHPGLTERQMAFDLLRIDAEAPDQE